MLRRVFSRVSLSCPAVLRGGFVAAAALLCLFPACEEKENAAPTDTAVLPAEWETGELFSGTNAYRHTAALCALGPRPSGSEGYAQQLGYLETRMTAAGWMVRRDSFRPQGSPVEMTNLHARFGESEGARPLLLSCHIDTKAMQGFIGADDGASGAGVLLELARVLAQTPELAALVEFVFLDGEESFAAHMTEADGLYGSKHDAAQRAASGTLPRYQVNLDMVGGADNVIAVPAYDTSDFMLAQYAKALMAENLPVSRWTAEPTSYRDDHRPYLEQGVDALNLIADFRGTRWWHRSTDTLDRIGTRTLSETGRLTLRLIRQLLP